MTCKEIGKDFLNLCACGNPKKAFELYIHKNFKHHNAYFKGDANSLMTAMDESAKQNPNRVFEIKNIIEEDDKIVFHSFIKQSNNDLGMAVIHILKFSENKIIEMWDLAQPIPENLVNENGMF